MVGILAGLDGADLEDALRDTVVMMVSLCLRGTVTMMLSLSV